MQPRMSPDKFAERLGLASRDLELFPTEVADHNNMKRANATVRDPAQEESVSAPWTSGGSGSTSSSLPASDDSAFVGMGTGEDAERSLSDSPFVISLIFGIYSSIVFSEAVAGFASDDDVTCPRGTLAAMTSGDSVTWTGTFTPSANTDDDSNTCAVGTDYTDTAGNTGTAGTSANYDVDTVAPTVSSIALSDTDVITGDTPTLTIQFSSAVSGFASADDVSCPNGALANMASGDSITWTGTFTPTADTEDDTNVCTVATSYTDTLGNSFNSLSNFFTIFLLKSKKSIKLIILLLLKNLRCLSPKPRPTTAELIFFFIKNN